MQKLSLFLCGASGNQCTQDKPAFTTQTQESVDMSAGLLGLQNVQLSNKLFSSTCVLCVGGAQQSHLDGVWWARLLQH